MTQFRKFSGQSLRLLTALLQQPRRWRHGYDLSQETGLKSGSLYPILMRLCERGLLESKWEESSEPGRPPRHMYKLTVAGGALANQQATAIEHAALGRAAGNHA